MLIFEALVGTRCIAASSVGQQKSFFKSLYLGFLTYGAFDVSVSQKLIQTNIYNHNVVQCAHESIGIISSTLQKHIHGILDMV